MIKIALFASGSGSNAQNIANYFAKSNEISVDCVLTNKPDAYVLQRLENYPIDSLVFSREDFYNSDIVVNYLEEREINFVVLAGFLWLVPANLVAAYPDKIVNIHPALLPKYGGKGMYGMHVHRAVVEAKEPESGISIHYVNERYDEGNIIFQAKCKVAQTDSPEDVADKIHQLEYEHFPRVIEQIVLEGK